MKCVYVLGQGNERMGFKWFVLIVSLLFVLFTLVTCMVIKEKSTVDVDSPSVGEMFRALLRNDQAMTVVITIVLINCSLYITSNLLIYFFKYARRHGITVILYSIPLAGQFRSCP